MKIAKNYSSGFNELQCQSCAYIKWQCSIHPQVFVRVL